MKALYLKYKTVILYIIFGGLTTVVNIAAFAVISRLTDFETTVPSNAAAWFLSVVFAFWTNKVFVFDSGKTERNKTFFQLISFFGARIVSGVLDLAVVFMFADVLGIPEMPVKIASNIIVIILNYAASKFYIFKKD